MKNVLKHLTILLLVCFSAFSHAITIKDSKGSFTIKETPKRIVVLEYSFVDALAIVGISPVGIADDKDKERIIKPIRDIIDDWQSVGTRSQPSLETISSLKPDLIIADMDRHEGIYKDLQKIAPTLILPSRRETYTRLLEASAIIGKVVNKDQEMQTRLAQHKNTMAEYAQQLPKGIEVQFGIALENYISLHPGKSYSGTVIQALGMMTPDSIKDQKASVRSGLEQLLSINPKHFIIGQYNDNNILKVWQNEFLWNLLSAVKSKQIYFMDDPNVWSRARGIIAAEIIAQDLIRLLNQPK
ncbi:Fe(3+) dicitrate ABC transporter substrate-binding protein [Marinomonas sp. C2222]|uniref:Fe(3+) dicitrate ABC transporter substrate-binding protein n=1 Tax=Marinomonas sargassi TaxID=2984494 RepID=A0ABT2YPU6_9GAMM|nr:Fe(3+) dicitrate ABC transporter substrate-binding protein [Marinomonas sargassi]MCV2401714.1 Fe(3+) dicitrate ABC transporter substrate-binding protein [Marinomonas sargassi]